MVSPERPRSGARPVLYRLILSYVGLVVLMSATTSMVSFFYFQTKYNKELEAFPQLSLRNTGKELQARVFEFSKSLYMDLSAQLSLSQEGLLDAESPWEGNAVRIATTTTRLKQLVAQNYDRIEDIHLSYTRQNVVVSSTGFHSRVDAPLPAAASILSVMRSQNLTQYWELYQRPEYLGILPTTLFRAHSCYPLLSTPDSATILMTIDFNAQFLTDIIQSMVPAEGGQTVLYHPTGYLGGPDAGAANLGWPGWLKTEVDDSLRTAQKNQASSRMVASPEGQTLVTVYPLSDSGWALVNRVASADLYKRGDLIWLTLVAIAVGATFLGLAVSSWLSSNLYQPLGQLMTRLKNLFGIAPGSADRDEYQMIGNALDQISVRLGGLEATVGRNRQAIRAELTLRLLEERGLEVDDWQAPLTLLALPDFPPRLRAAVITLSSPTRMLKYQVADELETSTEALLWTTPLADGDLGAIVGYEEADEDLIQSLGDVVAQLRQKGFRVTLSLGPEVGSPAELSESFQRAEQWAGFHFLFPDETLFVDRVDLSSRDAKTALPRDFIPSLVSALESRNLDRFKELLDQYRESALAGPASPRACHSDLGKIQIALAHLLPSLEDATLGTQVDSLDDALRELSAMASDHCSTDPNAGKNRNALLAERVRRYIDEHLGDALSLDTVGYALAVSPGYMSRIFKEETGRNFVAYTTEARLTRAADLLRTTRVSVQEIGRTVGIPTSAYFIRLFRGKYGKTPLEYRRQG